ncbi:MAG: EAL domain-containing protein [Desulfosarcina sp.]|nr:EAL domain-containing protein [Desulfobacterales bacterium]
MNNDHRKQNDPVILVVDDDIAMRMLMRESLEQGGMEVEEAENGVEALSAFKRFQPDVVLMDVKMPKMDGFTACSRLRQMPGGEDTTVVMVTSLEDVESIEQAYEAGATDFITKPINWPILNHRVRYLIRATAAFQDLHRSEVRLSQAQRIARLGNWEWNIVANEISLSEEIFIMMGLQGKEMILTFEVIISKVHPEDRKFVTDKVDKALYKNEPYNTDHRVLWPDETVRTVHVEAEVIFDEGGKPISMHGITQDITDRKKSEERIKFLAYYDTLTGLPNREMFKEYAAHALAGAQRDGTKVALLYLDIDQFKRVNDTLGHTAGDELLKLFAKQLRGNIRGSDFLAKPQTEGCLLSSLSRLGGDEFTILLTGLKEVENAAAAAKRILENLSVPVKIYGKEFIITGSMGISLYPIDGEDIDTLLKNADIAMYHAKDTGRNKFQFYSEEMNVSTLKRLTMEIELKKALERDEFVLYYQPQVESRTGMIVGLEALVRWEHPENGMVPPLDFIPIAEETGFIIPLGEWVLQTACEQMQAWQQAGLTSLRMAVNLSGRQFKQDDLINSVQNIINAASLDPQYLELELTESVLMHDVEENISTLRKLKESGLKLSVDDFGTGYSSMSYLKRFPLDTLKIDRCFVKDIMTDSNDAAITKAIIALAKSLNLTIIAEGVETEDQFRFLRDHGCDQIQGYLISKPLPAEEIITLLKAGKNKNIS